MILSAFLATSSPAKPGAQQCRLSPFPGVFLQWLGLVISGQLKPNLQESFHMQKNRRDFASRMVYGFSIGPRIIVYLYVILY